MEFQLLRLSTDAPVNKELEEMLASILEEVNQKLRNRQPVLEEKKVGDIFKIGNSQFICNESLDGRCDGCAFADLTECSKFILDTGHCSTRFRTDKKKRHFQTSMKRTSTILIAAVLSLTAAAQNRFEVAAHKADSIFCQTKEYKDMEYKIFETLNKYAIELSPMRHATPLADYLIENKISVPEVRIYYKMDQAKIIVWTSRKDKQKIVMELKQLTEMYIDQNNIERE